jgi:hypothetical protein
MNSNDKIKPWTRGSKISVAIVFILIFGGLTA